MFILPVSPAYWAADLLMRSTVFTFYKEDIITGIPSGQEQLCFSECFLNLII
jgi:hypothetical protein